MGNTLPLPNERMQRLIDSAELKKSEQKVLWRAFKRVDRDNSGSIDAYVRSPAATSAVLPTANPLPLRRPL